MGKRKEGKLLNKRSYEPVGEESAGKSRLDLLEGTAEWKSWRGDHTTDSKV